MARLTDHEKAQLLEATRRKASPAPRPARLPARQFLEFAAFASRFALVKKPVRFGGNHWKL